MKNTLPISAADRKDRALQYNGADRRYQETRTALVNATSASNHFLPKLEKITLLHPINRTGYLNAAYYSVNYARKFVSDIDTHGSVKYTHGM